jgi:Amt family ammonium transporter
MIAGAVGGAAAMFYMWAKYGKPDPSMTCNGALAGLVAITAPCAFVNSISAFIIGAIAGVLVCVSVYFVENKLKLDDPVGAISVHGVNGAFGILSLGLFADGTYGEGLNGVAGGVRGLFFGDASQLLAQLICIAVLIVWGFGSSYLFIKLLDKTMGIRVKAEAEIEGLDIPEMGALGYPSFQMMSQGIDGYTSIAQESVMTANATVPGFQEFAVEKGK